MKYPLTVILSTAGAADTGLDLFSAENLAGFVATAVVTVIGLLITVVILRLLLYKPILKVIEARRAKLQAEAEKSAALQSEAAAKEKTWNDKLANLDDELAEKRSRTLSEAHNKAEKIIREAREEAKQLQIAAESRAVLQHSMDKKKIHDEAVQLTVEALKRFAAKSYKDGDAWANLETAVSLVIAESSRDLDKENRRDSSEKE